MENTKMLDKHKNQTHSTYGVDKWKKITYKAKILQIEILVGHTWS